MSSDGKPANTRVLCFEVTVNPDQLAILHAKRRSRRNGQLKRWQNYTPPPPAERALYSSAPPPPEDLQARIAAMLEERAKGMLARREARHE